MVAVLFGILVGFIIGTVEVSLVGLSLDVPHGYPLESTNTGVGIIGTLLITYIGLWIGSEAFSCWCSWFRLMYCRKSA